MAGAPLVAAMSPYTDPVHINVGGTTYTSCLETLTKFPHSKLAKLFNGTLPIAVDPVKKRYFLDRDGKIFRHILNFLRNSEMVLPDTFFEFDLLEKEAAYFEIEDLLKSLEENYCQLQDCDRQMDSAGQTEPGADDCSDKQQPSENRKKNENIEKEKQVSNNPEDVDEENEPDTQETNVDHLKEKQTNEVSEIINAAVESTGEQETNDIDGTGLSTSIGVTNDVLQVNATLNEELNEAHLYMTVQVVLEDSFHGHQGSDLFNPDQYKDFRVKKSATLQELMDQFADAFKYPVEQMRVWPLAVRFNKTSRPTRLDLDSDLHNTVEYISEIRDPWNIFLECVAPNSGLTSLPPFHKDSDVLLFFKMYDPEAKHIYYCGHQYMPLISKVQELILMLNERAGFPPDTELLLFEEVKPTMVVRIVECFNEPLEEVIYELQDGDIIVFVKKPTERRHPPNVTDPEASTCREYFRDLVNRVEVTFCDEMLPNDATESSMELSMHMNYEQLVTAVAQRVCTDPSRLQFF